MLNRLKKYFFSGLAVFLPFILTINVCVWFLNFSESIFGKYLRPFLLENYDFYIWGLGIVVLVVLILLSGFLITNYFGRNIHRAVENIMMNVPLMGSIYPAFKEIAKFIFKEDNGVNMPQQVVLIEWPRLGIYTIGFLTNKTTKVIMEAVGQDMVNVLIPHVPNPLSGYFMMIPRSQIIPVRLTVEEAIKIIVSGGVVDPHALVSNENPS
ncbi:MAG: DUF502 domain-containing protein [Candidatus Omnitrophica bacterium]|nr:DUF502 domain-containing protein [Candidatus Omnitrophota bacterium]